MDLALQKYLNPAKLKVSVEDFKAAVVKLATALETNPNNLMIVFFNESGFNPAIINSVGAVGLIQFMPATLKGWGLTNVGVSKLNAVQQLGLVYNYYKPAKGKLKSVYDLYLWTFYPYALGKPDSFVIGSEKSEKWAKEVADANKIFKGDTGLITVGSFKDFIRKHYGSIIKQTNPEGGNSLFDYVRTHEKEIGLGLLSVSVILALIRLTKD